MSAEIAKYDEIFDYLSAPEAPKGTWPAVVFGRADPLLAQTAGDLILQGHVEALVISGGVGKDSGDILNKGFRSEAYFLYKTLDADAKARDFVLPDPTPLDERANYGRANAKNSVRLLKARGFETFDLTAVAHATSLRRLAATLELFADRTSDTQPRIYKVPTRYSFNAEDPADQREAALELLRLDAWPGQGWLDPQVDLPVDLVEFAKETHGKAPRHPRPLLMSALSYLPARTQLRIIRARA